MFEKWRNGSGFNVGDVDVERDTNGNGREEDRRESEEEEDIIDIIIDELHFYSAVLFLQRTREDEKGEKKGEMNEIVEGNDDGRDGLCRR